MDTISPSVLWHPAKKFLFRFCFVYFFLYCFPFPFDSFEFTKPLATPFYNFWDWLIPLIAQKWFNLHATPSFPMFDKVDDSNYGLAFLYFNLIVSVIASVIWTVLDQRRKNYEKLYQWLTLYLRYYLAAYLFGYGFIKVFPSQFQPITASRLTMTVGEQSPMLLAWNFMGYSTVMMRINGLAEVAAGLLLLFRRTTTAGALLSAGVFSFVVMMDFCFNVPVRLLASHLLIISVFLALADRSRLLNVFFLNKPVNATVYIPVVKRGITKKILSAALILLAICLLYTTIMNSIDAEKQFGQKAPRVPLYGVYRTAYFIRNHDTVPPLETDTLRWKQLVIDGGSWKMSGIVESGSGKKFSYDVKPDTAKKTIQLQSQSDTSESYLFHYAMQNTNDILIKGTYKKDSIEVLLQQYDLSNYPLYSEKFKWITR